MCDEENPGIEKQCEPGHGCYISLVTIPGGEPIFTRDCAQAEGEPDLCEEQGEEGGVG